ncbi:UbiA family prenyltransferase [Pseudofrankia sp. BMG5.37]|uniref:UbiA family prenyltransferase n=1 Tax=Pseudofrankia sp. BMG5.37 TaxID=3050035 RepID=UPI002895B4E8|nr:UbiA family prenyltransferase [Pseudofrankia sp. BMG5.37]MDT3444594.1 UbiA family prenyltransferase [Pseudofrankia sp. BMG5.37]
MGRIGALVRACHPEPTAAVTLFAAALAVAVGRPAAGVAAVAGAVVTGQLSVGWSNDLVDRSRDAIGGRAEKPVAAGDITPRTVALAAAVALVACVPLSFASGWRAGWVHLGAVASAWAYNLGLKATPLSVVPYAVSFALLPTFVVLGQPGHPLPPWWLPLAGALLGCGAHFANTLPDLATDAQTGVRGLPQRLGAVGARWSAVLLLVAGSVVALLGPVGPSAWRLVVLGIVAVLTAFGLRLGDRHAFRAAMAIAAIDVALIIASGTRLR